jgi:hypothetical protein
LTFRIYTFDNIIITNSHNFNRYYFKKKIGEAGGESISFDYDEKGRVNLAIVANHGYYFDSYVSISIVELLYFKYDDKGFLMTIIKNFEGQDFVSNVEIY